MQEVFVIAKSFRDLLDDSTENKILFLRAQYWNLGFYFNFTINF